MSKTGQELLDAALRLGISDRAALAVALIESLDGDPDADAEAAWAAEIERRAERARSGTDEGRPWEETRESARNALKER